MHGDVFYYCISSASAVQRKKQWFQTSWRLVSYIRVDYITFLQENLGCFPQGKRAAIVPFFFFLCAVFLCFHNPPNSDMDYSIFNRRTWSFLNLMHAYTHGGGHTDNQSAQHFDSEKLSIIDHVKPDTCLCPISSATKVVCLVVLWVLLTCSTVNC